MRRGKLRNALWIGGVLFCSIFGTHCSQDPNADLARLPNPIRHQLDIPVADDGRGGLIAVDLDQDKTMDIIVTRPGRVVAYDVLGRRLWGRDVDIHLTTQAENNGLPGWHAPGIQAADIDADGTVEVVLLAQDNSLTVLNGHTGDEKWSVRVTPPGNAQRWEHVVVANFRGKGDRDILLQATNARGYRMGHYLCAFASEDLMREKNRAKPLWSLDNFVANAHNGARIADLDLDGRDEVLGGMIISPHGKILFALPLEGHIDAIFAADVRPDLKGLEVVALEEGGGRKLLPNGNRLFRLANKVINRLWPDGNHIFLFNHKGLIWQAHHKHREPQNMAVGEFDPDREGLEIWCRSRYQTNQKPFVMDSHGHLISEYRMDKVAPAQWTDKGVEEISPIHWNGDSRQLAAAKERHKSGAIGIFDPMSGKFIKRMEEKADRIYVVDVLGDWREEIVVLSGNELHIYRNMVPNPEAAKDRLWENPAYRRAKMTWNYYNP